MIMGMAKTVEQRLYEAFCRGTGAHLSAEDVDSLVRLDDAVRTRITNTACIEAGLDEEGCDRLGACTETWSALKSRFIEEAGGG